MATIYANESKILTVKIDTPYEEVKFSQEEKEQIAEWHKKGGTVFLREGQFNLLLENVTQNEFVFVADGVRLDVSTKENTTNKSTSRNVITLAGKQSVDISFIGTHVKILSVTKLRASSTHGDSDTAMIVISDSTSNRIVALGCCENQDIEVTVKDNRTLTVENKGSTPAYIRRLAG